jgi:SSS family solute:Na+ symporter
VLLLLILLGYVSLQLAVGVVISRRIRGEDDYLLAGRKLGPVLATASMFATWFGAETCVGAAAEVYSGGLRLSLSDPFGYATCLLLFGLVLAVPLYKLRLTTLADLFRRRYSPGVERLAAILLIPSSLFWASAQIRAFGRVIAWGTSLSADTGIAIAAVTACLYTAFGGLLADAYADLIQGTVLCVCLLVLTGSVVSDIGGIAPTSALLADASRSAAREPFSLHALNGWAVPILGSLFAQELLSRAVASSSARIARRAAISAAAIYLFVGSLPLLLGAIARATLPNADPEAVLSALSQKHLGAWGYVVLTGALVSAILSTVDSALLVAGSFVSHNLAPALRPDLSDRQRLVIARCAVVVLAGLAYGFARGEGSVHDLVSQASAFGSAGVCVVGLMALFTRFGAAPSAYAALGLGAASWLLAEYVLGLESAFLLSFAVALSAYVGTALIGSPEAARAAD